MTPARSLGTVHIGGFPFHVYIPTPTRPITQEKP